MVFSTFLKCTPRHQYSEIASNDSVSQINDLVCKNNDAVSKYNDLMSKTNYLVSLNDDF